MSKSVVVAGGFIGMCAATIAAVVGGAMVAGLVAASLLIGGGSASAATGGGIAAGTVPAQYLSLYYVSGGLCPEISAVLLAAQDKKESEFDPTAVSPDGAEGIAQFLPATFAGLDPGSDPSVDIWNPIDEIPAQARFDCNLAQEIRSAGIPGDPASLMLAAYNAGFGAVAAANGIPASAEVHTYISVIFAYMGQLTAPFSVTAGGSSVGVGALVIAHRWLGEPYAFDGGNFDGPTVGRCTFGAAFNDCHIVGFDCSGLVLYAFSQASNGLIHMVHSAAAMYRTYPQIPAAQAQPGDLVFAEFGEDSPGLPGHVGIYEGNGRVLDAPHSGAFVREEAVAPWGYVTYARVTIGSKIT
jgi:cell wall-associated NlpC family hydrolase